MSKKKLSLLLIVALIAGIAIVFLQKSEKPRISPRPAPSIRIARHYSPGQFWVDIAQNKGWFKEAGLDVELVDTNSDYFGSLADTVAGKIDANSFGLFDLIKFNYTQAAADLVGVIVGDRASGADGIVAKKTVKTPADLKGKRIGVADNTHLDYILDVVLARYGVTLELIYEEGEETEHAEFTEVNIPAETAPEEFAKGRLDAVVTREPYLSLAAEKGGGQKIFDTSQIPGINYGIWAFQRSFIQERPAEVETFVSIWNKTSEFLKTQPQEAYAIIAGIYGRPLAEIETAVENEQILFLEDNLAAFSYAAGFESLHGTSAQILKFLAEFQNEFTQGETPKTQPDSGRFLDARFVRDLTRSP